VITHELINFLVEQGSDPKFGARSINRAVKNIVEDAVSKKILSGQVKEGDKIEVGVGELISS
jgi:ATP-dependent Clp protease ATP-binding subunit ClpC